MHGHMKVKKKLLLLKKECKIVQADYCDEMTIMYT
jgi:hypothetical protein